MRRRRMMAMAVTLLLVVAACGGLQSGETGVEQTSNLQSGGRAFVGDASAEPTTTTAAADMAAPGSDGDDEAAEPPSEGRVAAAVQTVTTELGRDIIFTAELEIAVTDVLAAGAQATRAIESLGGFVFGQQTTAGSEPRTVLTFKVFPDDFQEALERLGAIGEVRRQNVSASDVTDRIVDLESRINTAAASVERLRALLAEAQAIDVIAEIENQLLQRETQLETLRGQLRTLQDQVALATVVVTLTEAATRPGLRLDVTAYPGHDGEGLSCPGTPGLTVDEGTEVTLCFEVVNVGDTIVTDVSLRDPILDIETDDLVVVFGDLGEPMEPGESVLLAYETVAERDLRTQTTATAVPVDEEGNPLPGRDAAATTTILIDAVDPGGIPTFSEGLEASWDLLVGLGRLLVLIAGWLIPFVWVPVALWLVWRYRSSRPTEPVPTVREPEPEPEREPEPAGAGRADD